MDNFFDIEKAEQHDFDFLFWHLCFSLSENIYFLIFHCCWDFGQNQSHNFSVHVKLFCCPLRGQSTDLLHWDTTVTWSVTQQTGCKEDLSLTPEFNWWLGTERYSSLYGVAVLFPLNSVAEWSAFLLHIQEVQGSNLSIGTSCPVWALLWFSSAPPCKSWYSTLN
jgi:hypothetical protein